MPRSRSNVEARFWAKVDRGAECWVWTASQRYGYGAFGWSAGDVRQAHRVSWEFERGPIPVGMVVCHRCDNRSCVRPDHLFLGSQADNIVDMMSKGRGAFEDRHPMRRLTSDLVRQLRAEYDRGGWSLDEIGAKYGITAPTASVIVRGKTWPNAGGPIQPKQTTCRRRKAA